MKKLTTLLLFICMMPSIYAQNQTQKDADSYERHYRDKSEALGAL